MQAQVLAAACQAREDFDNSRGVPVGAFIYQRATARALTRYRQEWRYALRMGKRDTPLERAPEPEGDVGVVESRYERLERALTQLVEADRWLVQRLFWRDSAQSAVAAELEISQSMVSKRRKGVLQKLRALVNRMEKAE